MTLLNYLTNNDLIFYGAFAGTVGFIGYKLVTSYINSFYIDKGVQTEAWEDYSNRTSQMGAKSVTSIDTVTPISGNISPVFTTNTTSEIGTQTIIESSSTVTTVLPVPPINIEIIPNQDIKVYDLHELKTQEIMELFSEDINKNGLTDTYVKHVIDSFSITQLNSEDINEAIYYTLMWWI